MLFPKFWLNSKSNPSLLTYILYPISIIWLVLGKLHQKCTPSKKCPIPIICVGNITIGGNGKTPTALKLRSLLQNLGYKPHILSHGYLANLKGPHLVNPKKDSFISVGDEALMMAFYGPTWIARNRYSGIKAAVASGANVIIMDDGFQNSTIKKDFSLLIIETSIGFGNGYAIPAGPLREQISSGFKKADFTVTIGDRTDQYNFRKDNSFINKIPNLQGRLVAQCDKFDLKKQNVIGFAGISHPMKFKNTLEKLGANIIKFKAFTNHKPFKNKDLTDLVNAAEKQKALLITTEKDFVRIPKYLRRKIHVLRVELELQNQDFLLKKIMAIL